MGEERGFVVDPPQDLYTNPQQSTNERTFYILRRKGGPWSRVPEVQYCKLIKQSNHCGHQHLN